MAKPKPRIYAWSSRQLANIWNRIRESPGQFESWKVSISASGGFTVQAPGVIFVARESFPRGVKDLAWLSRVKPYTKRLTELPDKWFLENNYTFYPKFPGGMFRNIRKLRGQNVIYVDIAQAYWTALNHIYLEAFGENIPVSTRGVPKTVRNAAWGSLGASKIIYQVIDGEIISERREKEKTAIFWAVPWLVKSWLVSANIDKFEGIYWVDCVVVRDSQAPKVLAGLQKTGLGYHIIEGKAKFEMESGTMNLQIYDPSTGEVLKSQNWPSAILSY